jgi:putative hydrolase of the HAD superfamily
MIQAIVFDADGVLVKPPSWFVTRAHELYGVPKDEFMTFIHGDFKRCTIGDLDLEVALAPLLERWQVPVSIPEFIQNWLEHENVLDPGMIDEILLLRAMRLPCFVGTNQERNRANFMRLEMGLQAATDGVFASCDLGARKPDREFFDRLSERLNLEPASLLLIDDSHENVAGARAAGWSAEHFTNRKALRKRLESYLNPDRAQAQ